MTVWFVKNIIFRLKTKFFFCCTAVLTNHSPNHSSEKIQSRRIWKEKPFEFAKSKAVVMWQRFLVWACFLVTISSVRVTQRIPSVRSQNIFLNPFVLPFRKHFVEFSFLRSQSQDNNGTALSGLLKLSERAPLAAKVTTENCSIKLFQQKVSHSNKIIHQVFKSFCDLCLRRGPRRLSWSKVRRSSRTRVPGYRWRIKQIRRMQFANEIV